MILPILFIALNIFAKDTPDFHCTNNTHPCHCYVDTTHACGYPNPQHAYAFSRTGHGVAYNLEHVNLQGKNSSTDPNPHPKAQLKFANLKCANLSGAVFKGADFSGADLTGAQLPLTLLEDCNFQYAKLDHAQFNQARILNCDFRGCSLKHTNFMMADATGSDFSYSEMCETVFDRAKVPYTCWYKSKGSYSIGKAEHPGDPLYTNFCCSIDREGKLNHKACIGGYLKSSLNECVRNFNNLNLPSTEKQKIAPDLPLGVSPQSFIHKGHRMPLPAPAPEKPKKV